MEAQAPYVTREMRAAHVTLEKILFHLSEMSRANRVTEQTPEDDLETLAWANDLYLRHWCIVYVRYGINDVKYLDWEGGQWRGKPGVDLVAIARQHIVEA